MKKTKVKPKKASQKVIKVTKEKIGDSTNQRSKMTAPVQKTKRQYKDLDDEPKAFEFKKKYPRGG